MGYHLNCRELVVFFMSFYGQVHLFGHSGYISKDYCSLETFNPSCKDGEIIFIHKAEYGLMKNGRCVDEGYVNYIGCSSDQTGYLDKECSGLNQCDVNVHNREMKEDILVTCPEPYLQVSYSCENVMSMMDCDSSSGPVHIQAKSTSTYIASTTAVASKCGYGNNPFVLEALPGQMINITLYDFAWKQHGSSQPVDNCPELYGRILSLDEDQVINICGSKSKVRHLFLSKFHQVQIILQENQDSSSKYVIQFEAIGCPEIVPPKNAWMQKEDSDVTIGCRSTTQSWKLKCVGNHWIGVMHNCTQVFLPKVVVEKEEEFSHHHVMAFAVGCVAVIVCCITVTIGFYFIRRYRVQLEAKQSHTSDMMLLPHTTLNCTLNSPNVQTIAPRLIQHSFLPEGEFIPHSSDPSHTLASTITRQDQTTLNRRDRESVQYYVLEKPPGYINEDNLFHV